MKKGLRKFLDRVTDQTTIFKRVGPDYVAYIRIIFSLSFISYGIYAGATSKHPNYRSISFCIPFLLLEIRPALIPYRVLRWVFALPMLITALIFILVKIYIVQTIVFWFFLIPMVILGLLTIIHKHAL